MANIFGKSKSFNQRGVVILSPKSLAISTPKVQYRSGSVFQGFSVLVVIGLFVSFSLAICGSYIYVLPSLTHALHELSVSKYNDSLGNCHFFNGNWIEDDSYPLYNASECPFVEQGFNCLGNGRKDRQYLRWRWKPADCHIPRIDVHDILERLRNMRIVFVGDSMSRTQWESLICLLMSEVEDKTSVYEVNKNNITKQIRFLGVRFHAFNFTVEFFRSVFLVQHGRVPKHSPKRVKSTLRLDMMDDISKQWIDSDVLIFNTGHWWVPGKLFDTGCYFQVGNSLKLGMSIPTAFRLALDTWASWVNTSIDTNRTRVFFRTFEPSHWSDRSRRRFCNVTEQPRPDARGWEKSPFTDAIVKVVGDAMVPVTVLHVTQMSASRSDAHVGSWNDNPPLPDCSHWCLPGVPDTWNELFLSSLLHHHHRLHLPP